MSDFIILGLLALIIIGTFYFKIVVHRLYRYQELLKKYEPDKYNEMVNNAYQSRIEREEYLKSVREEKDIKELKRLKSKYEK